MGKLKYILRRIKSMDFGRLFDSARKVHRRSGKPTLFIVIDMVICGVKYQAGYMDYLVFEFERLTAVERATYITRGVNNAYVHKMNSKEHWDLFENKVNFNRTFNDFVGRDWLDFEHCDYGQFEQFVSGKQFVMVKTNDSICGHGVQKFNVAECADLRAAYDSFKEQGIGIVEDFVVQHSRMSRLYSGSVNTVRMVTALDGDTVHLLYACVRVGNGKSVDNLNSGGMATPINLETGVIDFPAVDKDNIIYEKHPISGTAFVGFEIPYFAEAKELVSRAAKVVPDMRLLGWDVAFSESGPLLIEANAFPGHDIYQFSPHLPDKLGFKPRFDAVINNIK